MSDESLLIFRKHHPRVASLLFKFRAHRVICAPHTWEHASLEEIRRCTRALTKFGYDVILVQSREHKDILVPELKEDSPPVLFSSVDEWPTLKTGVARDDADTKDSFVHPDNTASRVFVLANTTLKKLWDNQSAHAHSKVYSVQSTLGSASSAGHLVRKESEAVDSLLLCTPLDQLPMNGHLHKPRFIGPLLGTILYLRLPTQESFLAAQSEIHSCDVKLSYLRCTSIGGHGGTHIPPNSFDNSLKGAGDSFVHNPVPLHPNGGEHSSHTDSISNMKNESKVEDPTMMSPISDLSTCMSLASLSRQLCFAFTLEQLPGAIDTTVTSTDPDAHSKKGTRVPSVTRDFFSVAIATILGDARALRPDRYMFGPHLVRESEVFHDGRRCIALVNLRPVVKGHCLVICRRKIARFTHLRHDEACDIWTSAQRIGQLLETIHQGDSLTFAIQDGTSAGQTVPHVHAHILPRQGGDLPENDDVYDMIDASLQNHRDLLYEAEDIDTRTPRSHTSHSTTQTIGRPRRNSFEHRHANSHASIAAMAASNLAAQRHSSSTAGTQQNITSSVVPQEETKSITGRSSVPAIVARALPETTKIHVPESSSAQGIPSSFANKKPPRLVTNIPPISSVGGFGNEDVVDSPMVRANARRRAARDAVGTSLDMPTTASTPREVARLTRNLDDMAEEAAMYIQALRVQDGEHGLDDVDVGSVDESCSPSDSLTDVRAQ